MIRVWTDGCCLRNPGGAGGWAYLIERGGRVLARGHGYDKSTTNNQMELEAAISGLRAAKEMGLLEVELISDSKYVLKGIAQWIRKWKKDNWLKGGNRKRSVKNVELWRRLDREVGALTSVKFKWVPGHNGVVFNERVDEMAGMAARGRHG